MAAPKGIALLIGLLLLLVSNICTNLNLTIIHPKPTAIADSLVKATARTMINPLPTFRCVVDWDASTLDMTLYCKIVITTRLHSSYLSYGILRCFGLVLGNIFTSPTSFGM